LAKAELAAAVAKEKATQIEQIAEANLNVRTLCNIQNSLGSAVFFFVVFRVCSVIKSHWT